MEERADLTANSGEAAAVAPCIQLPHELVPAPGASSTISSPTGSGSRKRPHGDQTSHKIIEKRRRDRINNCLGELSRLIPVAYVKQGSSKLEKAEILEMTVEHLKRISDQPDNSGCTLTPHLQERYRAGYVQCMTEVRHYLLKEEGYTNVDQRLTRLMDHLHQRVTVPTSGQNHSIATSTSSISVGSERPGVSLAFCTSPMTHTTETTTRSAIASPNHSLAPSSIASPIAAAQSLQQLSTTQQFPVQAPQQQQQQVQQQQQSLQAQQQTPRQTSQTQLPQPTGSPLVLASQVLQPSQLQVTVLQPELAQGQIGQQSLPSAPQVLAHLGLPSDSTLQNVSFSTKSEPGSMPYCVAVAGQMVSAGNSLPTSSGSTVNQSQLGPSPLTTGTVIPTGQFLQVQQGAMPAAIAQLMVAAPQLSVLQPAVPSHGQNSSNVAASSSTVATSDTGVITAAPVVGDNASTLIYAGAGGTAVTFPPQGSQGTLTELPASRTAIDQTAFSQGVSIGVPISAASSQQPL